MIEMIECRSIRGTEREQFFSVLYERVFPSVARFVKKQGGHAEDAKDVFHDALIIFFEKKISGQLKIELTEEAYVFGIVKHLWIQRAKTDSTVLLNENESFITIPADFYATPDSNSILSFLSASGKKCMDLLKAFYYDKKSLDELKLAFGFSSVRSATVQKFKCLEKVREVVKNKSKRYEDFFE